MSGETVDRTALATVFRLDHPIQTVISILRHGENRRPSWETHDDGRFTPRARDARWMIHFDRQHSVPLFCGIEFATVQTNFSGVDRSHDVPFQHVASTLESVARKGSDVDERRFPVDDEFGDDFPHRGGVLKAVA